MSHDAPKERRPIAELLADAMADAGMNVSQLARALSARNGTQPESKRRLLQKYLRGTNPRPLAARELADVLGKPPDYFVTRPARPSARDVQTLWERVDELQELVDELRRAVADRRGEP